MAKAKKRANNSKKKPIQQYDHQGKKRVNNPPVGLVTPETDKESGKKIYAYDPHLDPQLVWTGKAERTSFEVPTVSLHVHERIDPRTIVEAVRRRNGQGDQQMSLFQSPEENPPLREAIEFYKHPHNWSNRLIAGDSLLVMNSLLEKEGMAGHVQMIYIDPPYGIRYGSNFQPFVNKRDVKDGKDEDLTQEPEMIRAFRDTWELGVHSYLAYLRDRLLIARELLNDAGSLFVQISDENVHHVKEIISEVFGQKNFCSLITVVKTSAQEAEILPSVCDYVLWYAKNTENVKYRKLRTPKEFGEPGTSEYNRVELQDGSRRLMTEEEQEDWSKLPTGAKPYRQDNIVSQRPPGDFPVQFEGKTYRPITGYWKTGVEGMAKLIAAKRIERRGAMLSYVRFYNDFPYKPISNYWADVRFSSRAEQKQYVVQTAARVIERCLLMTTDPGDLVLDITCGSGTTAYVADPEAAKDIDETDWPGVTRLKVQMNADLLTEDLKKKRASNESFWLVGQPDITVKKIKDGADKGKYQVEVMGFDYYNTKTGTIESGGNEKIAMWMLDTDYDERSLFPRQVFFPMAGENDGWSRLARNLKAEIDEELIEAYRGTVSLPFEIGRHKQIAVKIIDDRGIESLRIVKVD